MNNSIHGAFLMSMANRELASFMTAVTASYGPEQARFAAEDWLEILESKECLPEPSSRGFRSITVVAASRLANRVTRTAPDHLAAQASVWTARAVASG